MAPKRRTASSRVSAVPADQELQATKKGDAPKNAAAEESTRLQLDIGGVSYSCLCTRDPNAADDWAAEVLSDAADSGSACTPSVVVGFDCEWAPPWYRSSDRLATLQLFHCGSKGARALVFAVAGLNGKLPARFESLLGDSRVAKMGVNIAGDANRVVRDFGCPVQGLFDLARLNKKHGAKLKKSVSLEAIVKEHCPLEMHITKAGADVRTSNWETWPLSEEQVLYASRDAALSLLPFLAKFDISAANGHGLSKAAVDALVDLDAVGAIDLDGDGGDAGEPDAKVIKRPAAADKDVAAEPDKKNASFFQHMRNSNVNPPNIGNKDHPEGSANVLADVCIIVSGTLDSFERADFEKYVQQHGGKVAKTVTPKVTHLVTDHGEAGPSKLSKCKELGIPVVSEDVILNMVMGIMPPANAQVSPNVVPSAAVDAKPSAKKRTLKRKTATESDALTASKTVNEAQPAEERPPVTQPAKKAIVTVADRSVLLQAVPTRRVSCKRSVADLATDADEKAMPKGSSRSTSKSKYDRSTELSKQIDAEQPANVAALAKTKARKPTAQKPKALDATPKKARTPREASKQGQAETAVLEEPVGDANSNEATPAMKKSRSKADVVTEVRPTPPKKSRTSMAESALVVELDDEILGKADRLSLRGALSNLAGRDELSGKGFSAATLLTALEKTNGLVNPAKRLLLGL